MASGKKSLRQIIRKKIRKNKIEVKGNRFYKKAYDYYINHSDADFNPTFNIESNIEQRVNSYTVRSYIIDTYIEHILDEGGFTFDNPLLELDPYNAAPLSALMVFNTMKDCLVSYTVKGQQGAADYKRELNLATTRHKVPLIGLYDASLNVIDVTLKDTKGQLLAEKTIEIKTSAVDEVLKNVLTREKDEKIRIADDEFFLITGGFGGTTCAFDNCGNLRFALSKAPHPYGVSPMHNGHFLYVEKEMRRPNYGNAHSVITYEMDYLGRAYKTFKMAKGTHHWATTEEDSGKLLLDTSSYDDGHLENMISELDPENGKILRNFSMNDFFDDTYVNWHDWAHINSFHYIPGDDDIIVSCRNIHTIARLDLKNKKIKWIFTNPLFYKGTAQEGDVLKSEGEIDWFFQQHGVRIIKNDKENHKLQLVFFDNHTANRRPVEWFDKGTNSNLMVVEIDEERKTVKQLKRFPAQLSITRSNALVTDDYKTGFAMCGNLADHVPGKRAKIYEFDYETGEQTNLITCKRDFFCTQIININVDSCLGFKLPKEPRIYGDLVQVEEKERVPRLVRMGEEAESINKLKFRIFDDILQIRCKDHRVKKVVLFNKEHKYMLDFTDTKQESNIFKKQSYYICIPLDRLAPGKYKLGLKFKKDWYKTVYYIEK